MPRGRVTRGAGKDTELGLVLALAFTAGADMVQVRGAPGSRRRDVRRSPARCSHSPRRGGGGGSNGPGTPAALHPPHGVAFLCVGQLQQLLLSRDAACPAQLPQHVVSKSVTKSATVVLRRKVNTNVVLADVCKVESSLFHWL